MRFLCHLSFSLALNKYYRVADEEADTMAAAITKRDNRSDQGFPDFYWRTTTEVRDMMPLTVLRTPPERSSLGYGEHPVSSYSSAKVPKRRDEPYAFYDLPRNAGTFFEKEEWPGRVCGQAGYLRLQQDLPSREKGWCLCTTIISTNHSTSHITLVLRNELKTTHEGHTVRLDNRRYPLSIIDAFKSSDDTEDINPERGSSASSLSPLTKRTKSHLDDGRQLLPCGCPYDLAMLEQWLVLKGLFDESNRLKLEMPSTLGKHRACLFFFFEIVFGEFSVDKAQKAGKRTSVVPPKRRGPVLRVNDDNDDWRRIVRNFTPSYFSVTMGTGIVSILLNTLPYNAQWLYWISVVIFAINVLLFITGCIISFLRYTLYPEIFGAMIVHPV
ncbi:hypothetical protein IFM61392_00380 [Aspergillus lentulus]|nr:hypothetical protein IFM47457_07332 [Aspergillus lentulus]GFF98603.1 hypothetical protein IFM61392_00380 [Aspergillus lentulus]